MSTRSLIGKLNPDNTVTSIYCHHDGYPTYVGRILMESYSDESQLDKLLALGDLSVLDHHIGRKHSFDKHSGVYGTPEYYGPTTPAGQHWCLFYGRDRGETGISAVTHESIAAFLEYQSDAEYCYLLTPDGWICYDNPPTESTVYLPIAAYAAA